MEGALHPLYFPLRNPPPNTLTLCLILLHVWRILQSEQDTEELTALDSWTSEVQP